jgi:hypothetical protein
MIDKVRNFFVPKGGTMKLVIILTLLFGSFAHAASGDSVKIQTQTVVTATGTSTLALAANSYRRYLLLQNNGSTTVYVKFGSAHSGSEGVWILPGGNYEPIKAPIGAIYLKTASSTDDVTIIDGN